MRPMWFARDPSCDFSGASASARFPGGAVRSPPHTGFQGRPKLSGVVDGGREGDFQPPVKPCIQTVPTFLPASRTMRSQPSWRNDSLKSRISGHGGTQRLFLPQPVHPISRLLPADGIAMADKAALCLISAKDLAALSLARFISTKICSSVGLQKVCSS